MARWTIPQWLVTLMVAIAGFSAMYGFKASSKTAECTAAARPMTRLELVFGVLHRDGAPITEEQWASFVDTEVTPRFPDGLTILTAHGQWRNRTGRIVKLPSRLMLVWYRADEGSETRIEAVRTAYKERFDQDSVMRIDGASCVSF